MTDRRLRVLHVGKFYPPYHGGMETHLQTLCHELAAEVDVQVLVSNEGRETVREMDGPVPVTRIGTALTFGLKSFEELEKELEGRVNRDDRAKVTQASFVQKLKKEYKFTDKSKKTKKWFIDNIDSTYFQGKWTAEGLTTDKPMFILDGQTFTQKDFAAYLINNHRAARKSSMKDVVNDMFIAYQNEATLEIEKSKLAKKYPEYKALMSEYHDGILLYEIMSDKVWNKAMSDTTGLKNFFEANRSNYTWGKRVDAVVYETISPEVAQKVADLLKKGLTSDSITSIINKDSELNLRVRKNKFEVEKTNFLSNQNLEKGINSPYKFEDKNYVVFVNEVIEPAQKELSEAKGLITSDYQNHLEKEWLNELENKHSIKINEEVLYSIGK